MKKKLLIPLLLVMLIIGSLNHTVSALNFAPCSGSEAECAYQECENHNVEVDWLNSEGINGKPTMSKRDCSSLKVGQYTSNPALLEVL